MRATVKFDVRWEPDRANDLLVLYNREFDDDIDLAMAQDPEFMATLLVEASLGGGGIDFEAAAGQPDVEVLGDD